MQATQFDKPGAARHRRHLSNQFKDKRNRRSFEAQAPLDVQRDAEIGFDNARRAELYLHPSLFECEIEEAA